MFTIQNLSFGYNRQKQLFDNLSLTLEQGKIYGLLGRNGAGKSSLLRLMAGLLFPKAGSCRFNGTETHIRSVSVLEKLFFLPEEFHTPDVSIAEFLGINSPFYPKFNHQQFESYLEEFQLSKSERVSRLSYGQKKKALIGFGLASNVELLILDEPTNGLDIPSKSQFRRLIASNLSDNQTIIISTHQVRDLDGLIDNIIVLEENAIVLQKSMEEISERLSFRMVSGSESITNAIYVEQTMKGLMAVAPNLTHEHTRVDLELLFNAIVHKKELFQQAFYTNLIDNYHA